jgi:hypothetical protein
LLYVADAQLADEERQEREDEAEGSEHEEAGSGQRVQIPLPGLRSGAAPRLLFVHV